MKKKYLSIILLFVGLIMCQNIVIAQSNLNFNDTKGSVNATDNKVEIISNFKATKAQKKGIKKVKKYVTPRILGKRKTRVPFLEGKTITIQMHIDVDGNVGNFAIVKGIKPKLDNRVISLIKKYDTIHSFSASSIDKPVTIQIEFDVLTKKYYTN